MQPSTRAAQKNAAIVNMPFHRHESVVPGMPVMRLSIRAVAPNGDAVRFKVQPSASAVASRVGSSWLSGKAEYSEPMNVTVSIGGMARFEAIGTISMMVR